MRRISFPVLFVALAAASGLRAAASGVATGEPVPVVVELFTSEGCSSCPPADDVLAKLARQPSLPGVRVLALGWHVTYWDQLGWKDAASLPAATERQQDYGRAWNDANLYTPQAVVGGRDALVGSDEAALIKAIARAAREPQATASVSVSRDGTVAIVDGSVLAQPAAIHEPLDAIVVLVPGHIDNVGESAEGRTGPHPSQRRHRQALATQAGRFKPGAGPCADRDVYPRCVAGEHLHVAVILQGQ